MNQATHPDFVHIHTGIAIASLPISSFAGSYFLVLCLGFSVLHVLEYIVVVKYMKHFHETIQ